MLGKPGVFPGLGGYALGEYQAQVQGTTGNLE